MVSAIHIFLSFLILFVLYRPQVNWPIGYVILLLLNACPCADLLSCDYVCGPDAHIGPLATATLLHADTCQLPQQCLNVSCCLVDAE